MFDFIKRWYRGIKLKKQLKELERFEKESFPFTTDCHRRHQELVLELWETDFSGGDNS